MDKQSGNAVVMVPVIELYKECSYPIRSDVVPDATAASNNCRGIATSVVIEPTTGWQLYRCYNHRGLIKEQVRGEIATELPQRLI